MRILFLSVNIELVAQAKLSDRLIAYFPFSGNANDASGNNLHGTITNAHLTADRSGQANTAYQFDGATSYIQLPYSNLYNLAPTGAFSIATWLQPAVGNSSYGAVYL